MSVVMELVTTRGTSDEDLKKIYDYLYYGNGRMLPEFFVLPKYKTRSRRWTKYRKYMKQHFQYATYMLNSLVLPYVCKRHRQGWYFTKKLFGWHKYDFIPIYYAFTRADMLRLMDKLVDTSDPAGKEAYEAFAEEEFVEGEDIFTISW